MFESDQYQLLDFGGGRKLERFGVEILDRPSPAADSLAIADADVWATATARFESAPGGKGRWEAATSSSLSDDKSWLVAHRKSRHVMQLGASGNIGLFPEQASNWDWIAEQVTQCGDGLADRRPRVLNLFAYTGGASLAAASAGAEVTHVDSSGPTVTWAKQNAEASGMTDLPVRWLVEDAMKFVAREQRRGNFYDGIIADPPTYGHGPKGRPFKFKQHVDELVELCGQLLGGGGTASRFLLFSCHAPGFDAEDAASIITHALSDTHGGRVTSQPLSLESVDGRKLSAGVAARWSSAR